MKKYMLVIVASFFLFGCEKKLISEEKAALDEKKLFERVVDEEQNYDIMINTVAVGLFDLSKNEDFRKVVFQGAEKEFDGDYNVLLSAVDEELQKTGTSLMSELINSINSNQSISRSRDLEAIAVYNEQSILSEAINGFDYYDEKAFIQIYIPFIDNFNENTKQYPIIVLGLDDEETGIGYQTNDGKNYEQIIVTEQMARKNLTWVISVNEEFASTEDLERFLEFGPIQVDEIKGVAVARETYPKALRISDIYIYNKNESWINGKAEINFVSAQLRFWCSGTPQVITSNQSIERIDNGELSTWVDIPQSCFQAYPAIEGSALIPYHTSSILLYEKDVRRKWRKYFTPQDGYSCNVCTNFNGIEYRSKQPAYGSTYCDEYYPHVDAFDANYQWKEDYTTKYLDSQDKMKLAGRQAMN